MTKLVEFTSLSKKFGNNRLLENINFQLQQGEITTLVGQNGAGKTTLAKIILGLETYDSGHLYLAKNICIGYVPQKLDLSFNLPMTVECLLSALSGRKASNIDAYLQRFVNLELIAHKDVSAISGGQLQKVMLVGTILSNPDLIILDEPTQYLDVASQQEFYRMISRIKKELGVTIFMISHDLFTVMKQSDQVICLNGHVCCSGKPADLNNNITFKNALSEVGVYIHHHDHQH
ncbi:MAG: metal ABC transporter ATP-binding protein [Rickettsiaceae bacterium]